MKYDINKLTQAQKDLFVQETLTEYENDVEGEFIYSTPVLDLIALTEIKSDQDLRNDVANAARKFLGCMDFTFRGNHLISFEPNAYKAFMGAVLALEERIEEQE